MEDYDQLAAPGLSRVFGPEFEHPAEVDALFRHSLFLMRHLFPYGGGTADGPKTILEASWQLETVTAISGLEGIFTHAPIDRSGDASGAIEASAQVTRRVMERDRFRKVGNRRRAYGHLGLIKVMLDAVSVILASCRSTLTQICAIGSKTTPTAMRIGNEAHRR